MKAADAIIAWTPPDGDEPTAGQVKVGPLLEHGQPDWTEPYTMTAGAAFVERRAMESWQQVAMVFIDFHTLVVGDGMNPQAVHHAFLAIDEFRERMSPDIPGAHDPDEDDDASR